MLIDLIEVVAGLTLLLFGGDLLVRGASSLARSLGVSPLAVGLTVVAFGTSAPELAVSLGAALTGSGTLAFGNIFGSNLANIGLIIGLAALIRPLPIDDVVTRRELPMMLLAIAVAAVLAADVFLGEGSARYSRSDGLIFLLFFVVFAYYTVGDLIAQRSERNHAIAESGNDHDHNDDTTSGSGQPGLGHPWRDAGQIVLGLGGLLLGAKLTVEGSIAIALEFGVSETVIGLTLISVGTSLPELVATLTAIRRGELAIAVGGVVGSNIFNILLVCGLTSAVMPIEIPERGMLDLAATAVLSLVLLLTARTNSFLILRWEGAALLTGYLGYMAWRSTSIG